MLLKTVYGRVDSYGILRAGLSGFRLFNSDYPINVWGYWVIRIHPSQSVYKIWDVIKFYPCS